MPKIDVTTIEGFDEMSDADKLTALLNYEYEAPKSEADEKLKTALSRANADAAEWKRKYRETQTEQERAEAERAEEDKKKDELLKAYQERERISTYKAKLMTAGVDAVTAETMANSLPDGVSDEYFTTYQAFMETKRQEIEAAALGKQPGLSVGKPPEAKTADEKIAESAMKYAGL